MKNYQDSDYALNKISEGIVYRFADKVVEITLADFLAENPGKTEKDFRELKELSDAIFYDQDRDEYNQTRKNVCIHRMEETRNLGSVPLDEQYIEIQDRRYAAETIARLLGSGVLTKVQRRRFILHFVNGLTLRQIAKREGVFFTSVAESIQTAIEKSKKYFSSF